MSQKFCNILVSEAQLNTSICFCWGCESDHPHLIVRYLANLILSECYPLDLPVWLEHDLGIYGFRSTWSCLIVTVLVTWVKFLEEPSCYYTVINYTFCTTTDFDCFSSIMTQFELVKYKFPTLTMLHIHLCGFQITQWSNAQCVSAPITILPTIVRPYHHLNCIGHILYVPQTSVCQNIAQLLTHPVIFIELFFYMLYLMSLKNPEKKIF